MNPSETTQDVHLMNQDATAQTNRPPTEEETRDYIQELIGQRNGFLDQATALAATVKGLQRKLAQAETALREWEAKNEAAETAKKKDE